MFTRRAMTLWLAGWSLAIFVDLAAAQMIPGAAGSVDKNSSGVAAGGSQKPKTDVTPVEPDVSSKRAENAELLRLAQRRLEAGESADSAAAQEVALFKTVEAVLAQQEAVGRQIEDLKKRKTTLAAELSVSRSAASEKKAPLPFIEFDRLKDELATEKSRANLASDRLAASKDALARSKSALEKSQTKRRQTEEAFNAGKSGPTAAELSTAFEQAKNAVNLATETVKLRERELEKATLSQEVQQLAVELKQDAVNRAAPMVVFSRSDLDELIAQIDKQEEAANSELALAQSRRMAADQGVREVQQQPETGPSDDPQQTERLAARQRELDRWSDEVDLITQQLRRLAQLRITWGRRFSIAAADRGTADAPSIEDIKTWQKEARAEIDELASDASGRIHRMADLRSQLAAIADRTTPDTDAAVTGFLNAQRIQMDEMLRSQQASLVQIESSRRVYAKLLDELGANALSAERLAAGALAQVTNIWEMELFRVGEGDDETWITVRSLVIGFAVLIIGWIMSRMFSRIFANRLLKRFRLSKDAHATLGHVAYYAMLVIVVLIALKTVSVPLTAFTILGGALAIGVGFGSQALINNFIGGLIMLAERPVRLGERITFGELDGIVEEVGFRCTKLRTLTDHLVTIPNSSLVNDSIENIGRRRTIRRLFNVTVTYDTPREKVEAAVQAIRNILNEKGIRERIHPIVGFEEFPPRVFFNDYNSESLNIIVLYWYAPPEWWDYMEHCERVNFRIMEEYEKLGVEFAFPTKTLYLAGDPKRELTVRLKRGHDHKDRSKRNVA